MKNYKITIDRYCGDGTVSDKNWKNLISSLVLAGYEVYGDDEKIVYNLGYDDKCEEIKND